MRLYFEKIVWVSVGQTPNMLDLQNSIHTQLVGAGLPDEIKGETDVLAKLKELAKGVSLLLVLDDVWDVAHELALKLGRQQG